MCAIITFDISVKYYCHIWIFSLKINEILVNLSVKSCITALISDWHFHWIQFKRTLKFYFYKDIFMRDHVSWIWKELTETCGPERPNRRRSDGDRCDLRIIRCSNGMPPKPELSNALRCSRSLYNSWMFSAGVFSAISSATHNAIVNHCFFAWQETR